MSTAPDPGYDPDDDPDEEGDDDLFEEDDDLPDGLDPDDEPEKFAGPEGRDEAPIPDDFTEDEPAGGWAK